MRMKSVLFLLAAVAALSVPAVSLQTNAFPRVWMSLQWDPGMEAKVADLAAHGVEVIEVSSGSEQVCREALALCRKYGLKAFVYADDITKRSTPAVKGRPYERAVMLGGVYRGQAIDRTLYAFTPERHEIIIEPPVYSKRQPYEKKVKGAVVRSGHYFGNRVPVRAEVIVPLKPFDGEQHLRIVPAEMEVVAADTPVEGDTATDAMRDTPEVRNRRLVRLRFDLSAFEDALLDRVGIAVYWTNDVTSEGWRNGSGQMSVFSPETRAATVRDVEMRLNRWTQANDGTFPSDVIIAMRWGDECFNVTGWLDGPAASYPIYGYSDSGLAAFRRLAPEGLEPPRTWGCPEIYGAEAYGTFLYAYHQGCADLARAAVDTAHRLAPGIKVFRNTTRSDAWSYGNDHDGSGQELLAETFDLIHLDPYPVTATYEAGRIPFDMAYLSGLARRLKKPILPWLQAHAYAPGKLGHVTPEQVERMWRQHRTFAPDGLMWLGYGGEGYGIQRTFPNGNAASWEKAGELHREFRNEEVIAKPVAKLAVLRHYSTRALVCELPDGSVRNPADALLREYVRAWSVDCGHPYDVFEIPPCESEAARQQRLAALKGYDLVVSTVPEANACVIGEGTVGRILSRRELSDYHKACVRRFGDLMQFIGRK